MMDDALLDRVDVCESGCSEMWKQFRVRTYATRLFGPIPRRITMNELSSEIILTIGFLFAQLLPQLNGLFGPLGSFGVKLLGGQAYVIKKGGGMSGFWSTFPAPTHASARGITQT